MKILLGASSLLLVSLVTANGRLPRSTDVSEEDVCTFSEDDNYHVGYCNVNNGLQACESFCRRSVGKEYLGSACENRSGGKKECQCSARCAEASCFGDPHCVNFDGGRFEYQGTCRHLLVRPLRRVGQSPLYQIYMRNREWHDSEEVTVPDVVEIIIEDWKLGIHLSDSLLVNGKAEKMPFRFHRVVEGYKETSLEVSMRMESSHESSLVQITTLKTSFGLTVINMRNADFSDVTAVYVRVPKRHPGFFHNTMGLFGIYDDDGTNDFTTLNGAQFNPENSMDVWMWGDSWCANKSEVSRQNVKERSIRAHEHRLTACHDEKTKQRRTRVVCQALNHPLFKRCLGEKGQKQAIDDCFEDACYAASDDEERVAACNVIRAYSHQCRMPEACV